MKKKKKVLIISYSYPPANVPAAQRPYSIAKYLDKDKFDVTVLTCGNQDSALGFDNKFNEQLPNVKLQKINGIKISKNRNVVVKNKTKKKSLGFILKQYLINKLSIFIYPDKAIFWYPKAIKFINSNKNKFDIIFSTSPAITNHLLALKLKKITPMSIYISDFRDYFYLHNTSKKNNLRKYFDKYLEKLTIKKSDKVCFISYSMKQEYKKSYPRNSYKFHTIYNGFDLDEYKDIKPTPLPDKLSIFYAGSFYKGIRNPLPLLTILEELIKNKTIPPDNIQIEIAGNFEQELVENIKSLKIFQSIKFLGLLPRNEVLKKYKSSHLLWLIVGNKINHYTSVPIKLYEYLASQRPIINFAPSNSEPSKIINELNIGWNFDTNKDNFQQQVEQFKEIVKLYKQGKLNKDIQANKINQFTRQTQTKQLEQIFEN